MIDRTHDSVWTSPFVKGLVKRVLFARGNVEISIAYHVSLGVLLEFCSSESDAIILIVVRIVKVVWWHNLDFVLFDGCTTIFIEVVARHVTKLLESTCSLMIFVRIEVFTSSYHLERVTHSFLLHDTALIIIALASRVVHPDLQLLVAAW